MPLPDGWTAYVTETVLDSTHAPAQWIVRLVFQGSGGAAFPVEVRLDEPDLRGLTRQGWINLGWSRIGAYVLQSIAAYGAQPSVPASPGAQYVGQQVEIP